MNYKALVKSLGNGEKAVLSTIEKYGNTNYLIESEEQLKETALYIVKNRFNDGYWYNDPTDEEPEKLSLTEEQRLALPAGPVRRAADEEYENYQRAYTRWQREVKSWNDLKTTIKDSNGQWAYSWLMHRSSHEYEEIQVEILSVVKNGKVA